MMDGKESLLSRWHEGTLTKEELARLSAMYDIEELEAMKEGLDLVDVDIAAPQDIWTSIQEKQSHKERPESRKYIWSILVILLLTLISAGIFYMMNNSGTTITTEIDNQIYAHDDGTTIELSPASTIKLSESDWSKERKVKLEGQAYFEVAKGSPFTVNTAAGTIQVLGTKFDIWTINDDWMTVKCTEGSVSVSDGKATVVITAGQQVRVSNGQLEEIIPSDNSEIDWQEGYRMYRAIPVELIMQDISRFYPEIFLADKDLNKEIFTGKIPTNDLDKTINFINESLGYVAAKNDDLILFSVEE